MHLIMPLLVDAAPAKATGFAKWLLERSTDGIVQIDIF